MFFRINFDQPYTHRRQNHDLAIFLNILRASAIYCAQIAIFRYPKRNNLLQNHDILRNPTKFGTGNKINSRMYVFRVNSNQPCIQRRQNHYFAIFFNILRSSAIYCAQIAIFRSENAIFSQIYHNFDTENELKSLQSVLCVFPVKWKYPRMLKQ